MEKLENQEFNFTIDKKFIDYFNGRIKQVFLYITDACQLRCKQCLYKPNLVFHMKRTEIDLETLLALSADFKKMGAIKLTIMGGEPSLYGDIRHIQLGSLIAEIKKLGYKYVRMDTNGQYNDDFLNNSALKKLDEVSFSLDGFSSETNDILRGQGAFDKTVANIKRANALGYNIDLTACVHRKLAERDLSGILNLEKMIYFTASLGVKKINFHVLFKHGFPMDTWTEETNIEWYEWVTIYNELRNKIDAGIFPIHVRIPQHFVSQEEFDKKSAYYGYCAAKLGERILVHPDGMLRICSGLISSKYCIAKFYDKRIVWEEGYTNELLDHDFENSTPCTNQQKTMNCGPLVPLCFSLKPLQKEIVWQKELQWELKR